MYKAGQFNYKLSGTGRQGDLMGGGITGGYMWRLNEALSMDFSFGLGYLHVDCEKYEVTDGVRVRSGNETKHWIGPQRRRDFSVEVILRKEDKTMNTNSIYKTSLLAAALLLSAPPV